MNIFDELKESVVTFIKNKTTKYKNSTRWKEYKVGATLTYCSTCIARHNKIYEAWNVPQLPEHQKCRCVLNWLKSLSVGSATSLGMNGADFYLKHYGILPSYYITKEEAMGMGWKSRKGNLDKVAPGKMIGGDIFKSAEGYLPYSTGRIWYECDIDYQGGYRNNNRLVYSNDGLIFKTDSHYTEFIAIE